MTMLENSPRPPSANTAAVPVDRIRKQVGKIIQSPVFFHSKRMQRFLSFTVEQALRGNEGSIKEYSIALAVFDKPGSFDPRLDPIVRVEAGRLRSKLREYYDGPGRQDTIRIIYRKRSYVPLFEDQSTGYVAEKRPFQAASDPRFSNVASMKLISLQNQRQIRAIAVLPFLDLSELKKLEYFSDALTAEIINVLNQTIQLKIVSRTSVLRFKDTDQDIREIAGQLGVDAVLEGSVRLAEKRVRVTVQLANAADGYQIWSQIYDREIADIFDVQSDIADAIAQELKHQLR